MGQIRESRPPVLGVISFVLAWLILSIAPITSVIPTGNGEAGFANYVVNRVFACFISITAGLGWILLAGVSVWRRERETWILVIGFGLSLGGITWCLRLLFG